VTQVTKESCEIVSDVIIQTEDFDVAVQYAELCERAPRSGAVVFFVGLVRDLYGDALVDEQGDALVDQKTGAQPADAIDYLELTHYEGMTQTLCQQIVDEARARYPFDAARVVHRVGKLYCADQIVMVAIASRHRDAAFSAAQFIMDYLKTRATLWKKEVGSRGEQWIGINDKDSAAADKWSQPD
jgi:molybdopterin synthase catalytic subunit